MEINFKLTISFLLPAAFMSLLVACGDTQPLSDVGKRHLQKTNLIVCQTNENS
jgi:hypothetical protein